MINKKKLALAWFDAGIFLDKSRSPNGKGFRLKLHEKNPDAPLSPFYLNFRLLRSFPWLLADTAGLLVEMKEDVSCDLVADVPTAATPLVTLISYITNNPMITPREMKTHGAGGNIDGIYQPGQRVSLFDDLITKADSKFSSASVLEAERLQVEGIFMLVDREQGGMAELANAEYQAHVAWRISELLGLYLSAGKIDQATHDEIMAYLFPTV